MAVSLSICNLALWEIRAPKIVSIDEASVEANACRDWYPICLQTLLESYEWGFGQGQATLALLSTNARSNQWSYAYQMPAGVARPLGLVDPLPAGLPGYYYPWPYDWPRPSAWVQDYIIADGVLYANTPDAALAYSSTDIDESEMPALFKRALAVDLAAELAVALREDRDLKERLVKEGEIIRSRAIANDRNRQPIRQGFGFDEVSWARG